MSNLPLQAQPSIDQSHAQPLPRVGFILLAAVTLFWGMNWPVLKLALLEVPVWTFRSLCLLSGGLGLLIIARVAGHSLLVPRAEIRPLLICALFNIVGWHLFSAYGVSLMAAGRASIIAFTMPIWAAILGRFWLGERLSGSQLTGLLCGVVGLAFLIGPGFAMLRSAPWGAILMLAAAVSWAIGTVALKRYRWTVPTAMLAGWQLLTGGILVTIGALLFEDLPSPTSLSAQAVAAVVYIIAFPMLLCHWAWFAVVRLFPAVAAAVGTMAIPVVGVLSSELLLAEHVGWSELVSLGFVSMALALVLVVPAWRVHPPA